MSATAKSIVDAKMTATRWPFPNVTRSELELELARQLTAVKIPFECEVVAITGRKFRFDFKLAPDLLVEVDGGTWSHGRHARGSGIERDAEKMCLAAIAGYRVMRVTGAHIRSGRALAWIEEALK